MNAIRLDLVPIIRAKALKIIDEEFADSVDWRDIERIKSNDTFVWRFVEDQKSDQAAIEAASKAIVDCVLWRHKNKINDLKASDFPREIWESGRIRVGRAEDGTFVAIDRIGLYRKNAEWREMLYQVCAFDLERFGQPVNGSLYLNLEDACFASLDLKISIMNMDLFTRYYPNTFKSVYIYGLPAAIRPFLSLCLSLLPQRHRDRIHFIDRHTLDSVSNNFKLTAPENAGDLVTVGVKRSISREAIDREIKHQQWVKRITSC